ncbi:hypothetical protein [Noviherbaspirillum suwonense]|jgi:hypothetical protein|uniref:Uncharacterized protein n=1 Tax=Noviherbaspirillum suwonense TaxID=1224511 RepID=A0ABY1Q9U5_9BURK|nr:hypothetical protein [Noviherbaspirillum suwonense]SMP63563.1 Protein of unknown function [Noviherbaspirillum suwonense]
MANQARKAWEAGSGTAQALPALRFLRFNDAAGCRLVCVSGVLLVTVAGVSADIELYPADSFVIPNGGLVLVEAVRESSVRVEKPAAFHRAWPGWTGRGALRA